MDEFAAYKKLIKHIEERAFTDEDSLNKRIEKLEEWKKSVTDKMKITDEEWRGFFIVETIDRLKTIDEQINTLHAGQVTAFERIKGLKAKHKTIPDNHRHVETQFIPFDSNGNRKKIEELDECIRKLKNDMYNFEIVTKKFQKYNREFMPVHQLNEPEDKPTNDINYVDEDGHVYHLTMAGGSPTDDKPKDSEFITMNLENLIIPKTNGTVEVYHNPNDVKEIESLKSELSEEKHWKKLNWIDGQLVEKNVIVYNLKEIIKKTLKDMKYHLKHDMSYFGRVTVEEWIKFLEEKP